MLKYFTNFYDLNKTGSDLVINRKWQKFLEIPRMAAEHRKLNDLSLSKTPCFGLNFRDDS